MLQVLEKWGYGKAFGQISMQGAHVNSDQFVFPAWKPWTWNFFCFIADSTSKTFKAILNNETIYESKSYNKQHEISDWLLLMDSSDNNMKAYGEVTDVQIWDKKITNEGNVENIK